MRSDKEDHGKPDEAPQDKEESNLARHLVGARERD
jgi:hypothetical protein